MIFSAAFERILLSRFIRTEFQGFPESCTLLQFRPLCSFTSHSSYSAFLSAVFTPPAVLAGQSIYKITEKHRDSLKKWKKSWNISVSRDMHSRPWECFWDFFAPKNALLDLSNEWWCLPFAHSLRIWTMKPVLLSILNIY